MIGLGEFKITRVMPWHGHDRAGPVSHKHVVRNPNGNLFIVHRIDRVGAGKNTRFLFGEIRAVEIGFMCRRGHIFIHGLFLRGYGNLSHNRMFRRKNHIGSAEKRVRPCGENTNNV